jgi:hypothetical protein
MDDIKMDIRETGLESVDWINMANNTGRWRPLMKTVMNIPFPYIY